MERRLIVKSVSVRIRKMFACIMVAVMTIIAFTTQTVKAADNGLYPAEDGAWYYYSNGVVDYTYTGLVQYGDSWWYVENGGINFDYCGLIEFGGVWWCVAGGRVAFEYTGLWNDPNVGWWYSAKGGGGNGIRKCRIVGDQFSTMILYTVITGITSCDVSRKLL